MRRTARFVEPHSSVSEYNGNPKQLVLMTGGWGSVDRNAYPTDVYFKAQGIADASSSLVCLLNHPYVPAHVYMSNNTERIWSYFRSASEQQLDEVAEALEDAYDVSSLDGTVYHGQSGSFPDAVVRTELQHDGLPPAVLLHAFDGIGLHSGTYKWKDGLTTSRLFDTLEKEVLRQGSYIQPSDKYQSGGELLLRAGDIAVSALAQTIGRAQLWRASIIAQLRYIVATHNELPVRLEIAGNTKALCSHLGGLSVIEYAHQLEQSLQELRPQNPQSVHVWRNSNTSHASYDNIPFHAHQLSQAIHWAKAVQN